MSKVFSRTNSGMPRAFTLVELLAAIFIIALLIGILLPSVTAARNSAKNVKIKAQEKAIADALENFRSDNQKEFAATNGFPQSSFTDDPTETTADKMCGGMWLARYLIGKDLQGFVPKRAVPPSLLAEPEKWYLPDAYNNAPLERAPVYLESDKLDIKTPSQIASGLDQTAAFPASDFGGAGTAENQIMIIDTYGRPMLYYVANHLAKPGTPLAKQYITDTGISSYTFEDNSVITGDNDSSMVGWQFGGGPHKLAEFGETNGAAIGTNTDSFTWYILDKNAFEASKARVGSGSLDLATVQAVQRTSFLLISAGLDGVYGTPDDITNFER